MVLSSANWLNLSTYLILHLLFHPHEFLHQFAEAEQKNKAQKEKIDILATLEAKYNNENSELEKKYNVLLEENESAYPKKVEELKTLCQQ